MEQLSATRQRPPSCTSSWAAITECRPMKVCFPSDEVRARTDLQRTAIGERHPLSEGQATVDDQADVAAEQQVPAPFQNAGKGQYLVAAPRRSLPACADRFRKLLIARATSISGIVSADHDSGRSGCRPVPSIPRKGGRGEARLRPRRGSTASSSRRGRCCCTACALSPRSSVQLRAPSQRRPCSRRCSPAVAPGSPSPRRST